MKYFIHRSINVTIFSFAIAQKDVVWETVSARLRDRNWIELIETQKWHTVKF